MLKPSNNHIYLPRFEIKFIAKLFKVVLQMSLRQDFTLAIRGIFNLNHLAKDSQQNNKFNGGSCPRTIRRIYGIWAKKRAKGRKLPSQPASSRRCFRSKCRNFRPDRKGQSSKERSQTATKEPKKRRVQSLHLLRSNEAEQQRRREKMKGKP
ncbi:hypothetical protein M5K25_014081 [Dendrobium thyrsiflorum]|uniref:Uncharacterized protein n=1 Tax=Dendrobium thyrsiflorum TaxID=117978 RepID=A0ABD0UV56_DENTH